VKAHVGAADVKPRSGGRSHNYGGFPAIPSKNPFSTGVF